MYCEIELHDEKVYPLEGERNSRLNIYRDYYFRQTYPIAIRHQKREISQQVDLLQRWLDNDNNQNYLSTKKSDEIFPDEDSIDIESDLYFDCAEQLEVEPSELDHILMSDVTHPWISEIWLSIHRKTSLFRRVLNYFNRSSKRSFSNLAEEFVRVYAGRFNHPIGFQFHISYAKEKWLLILKDLKLIKDYSIYPYPQTRIIFIRKGLSFIVR